MTARYSAALLILFTLAAVLVACRAPAPQAAAQLNQNGNRQYAARNFSGALETYRRAEVLRPDLPALNYNVANTLNQQKDYTRAVDEAQRAVHTTDADVQDRAYYSMGNAYVRSNQLREAVDAYKSALRVDPADADAKYNLEVIQRRLDAANPPGSQPQQGAPGEQQAESQPGINGQPQADAQSQPEANGQPPADAQPQLGQSQSGQAQAGQPSQPSGSSANSGVSGYTGTPEGQAASLDPNLKQAIDQFNQSGNVDDALRALDIAQQQERLQQAAGNADSPQPQGRDW